MATAMISNDESSKNDNDDNLEIFSIIWLDSNDDIDEIQNTEQKLRAIINHFKRFQDAKECQQYIEQKPKHDRLVLIVSRQLGQEIVPFIHNLRQVSSIYVYCQDKESGEQWINNFIKVKMYSKASVS
jgi:response regulator RpfG family c-di-GMP phosphodiesterase